MQIVPTQAMCQNSDCRGSASQHLTPESILSQEDFKSQHLWGSRDTSPAVTSYGRSCSLAAWGSGHLETPPKAAERSTLWVTRSTVLADRLGRIWLRTSSHLAGRRQSSDPGTWAGRPLLHPGQRHKGLSLRCSQISSHQSMLPA